MGSLFTRWGTWAKKKVPIYGVSGLYQSNPALTRTDDAVGMSFVINSSSGAITSDFNSVFPWNEATVETINGNVFLHMPEMWFRVGWDASKRITDVAVSKARGSTGNWYKVESFYYGCYGGSVSSSKLKSVSGVARQASTTRGQFRTYAVANGSGYYQLDLYHRMVMLFLWWIEWATKNGDSIMRGRVAGSGTSGGGTARNTGGTNSITTPSGFETAYEQMRYHYIEDFVGNYFEFVDGVVGSGTSGGLQYVTANPSLFSDTTTGLNVLSYNSPVTSGDCLAAFGWDSANPFLCLPIETYYNGDYTSYFYDYCSKSNYTVLFVGAYRSIAAQSYGVSRFDRGSVSDNSRGYGGRLLYKP